MQIDKNEQNQPMFTAGTIEIHLHTALHLIKSGKLTPATDDHPDVWVVPDLAGKATFEVLCHSYKLEAVDGARPAAAG